MTDEVFSIVLVNSIVHLFKDNFGYFEFFRKCIKVYQSFIIDLSGFIKVFIFTGIKEFIVFFHN